jgi:hypothetical protein
MAHPPGAGLKKLLGRSIPKVEKELITYGFYARNIILRDGGFVVLF